MKKMKLVMIGNGMAGVRTLEELLKIAPDLYDITVFGAEPHPNYNRILLSPVLAGEMTLDDAVRNDLDWYNHNGIKLHVGKRVERIDRRACKVIAADGTESSYDRLLLATGSNPVMLPIPGVKLDGVLTYRDIQDTQSMIEASQSHRHAVVIGGGLLGLEAANGLKQRGMNVTVVHLMDWLMERQLDRTAANMLQRSLENKGLQFLLSTKTTEIVGYSDGRVKGVRFVGGSELVADLVVMAVGIRPNTELAQAAGIHCERRIVGSVLYGDTVDSSWYLQLLRDQQDIHDIRDHIMFGRTHLGNTGHQGQNLAASMPDAAEVCGCNGVCKGTIVKAIKEQGLFTLDEVRKHNKAASSCGAGTGLVQ